MGADLFGQLLQGKPSNQNTSARSNSSSCGGSCGCSGCGSKKNISPSLNNSSTVSSGRRKSGVPGGTPKQMVQPKNPTSILLDPLPEDPPDPSGDPAQMGGILGPEDGSSDIGYRDVWISNPILGSAGLNTTGYQGVGPATFGLGGIYNADDDRRSYGRSHVTKDGGPYNPCDDPRIPFDIENRAGIYSYKWLSPYNFSDATANKFIKDLYKYTADDTNFESLLDEINEFPEVKTLFEQALQSADPEKYFEENATTEDQRYAWDLLAYLTRSIINKGINYLANLSLDQIMDYFECKIAYEKLDLGYRQGSYIIMKLQSSDLCQYDWENLTTMDDLTKQKKKECDNLEKELGITPVGDPSIPCNLPGNKIPFDLDISVDTPLGDPLNPNTFDQSFQDRVDKMNSLSEDLEVLSEAMNSTLTLDSWDLLDFVNKLATTPFQYDTLRKTVGSVGPDFDARARALYAALEDLCNNYLHIPLGPQLTPLNWEKLKDYFDRANEKDRDDLIMERINKILDVTRGKFLCVDDADQIRLLENEIASDDSYLQILDDEDYDYPPTTTLYKIRHSPQFTGFDDTKDVDGGSFLKDLKDAWNDANSKLHDGTLEKLRGKNDALDKLLDCLESNPFSRQKFVEDNNLKDTSGQPLRAQTFGGITTINSTYISDLIDTIRDEAKKFNNDTKNKDKPKDKNSDLTTKDYLKHMALHEMVHACSPGYISEDGYVREIDAILIDWLLLDINDPVNGWSKEIETELCLQNQFEHTKTTGAYTPILTSFFVIDGENVYYRDDTKADKKGQPLTEADKFPIHAVKCNY